MVGRRSGHVGLGVQKVHGGSSGGVECGAVASQEVWVGPHAVLV